MAVETEFLVPMALKSDAAAGRVWRYPRYTKGGYDKNCYVQTMLVRCFEEKKPMRPLPDVHVTGVIASGVRGVAKLKEAQSRAKTPTRPPNSMASAFEAMGLAAPGKSLRSRSMPPFFVDVRAPDTPKPASSRPRRASMMRSCILRSSQQDAS
eukprot:TRINITY_DN106099_c0_g1_i1.p1 TRINITY_DN106099_c0_g1~~TRINITY_DN106099_c0_g1_i1.p1  ORF type:complete len:178 (-),score=24.94 TRINITY_DN106099_c0_g1_i1:168-626(-)